MKTSIYFGECFGGTLDVPEEAGWIGRAYLRWLQTADVVRYEKHQKDTPGVWVFVEWLSLQDGCTFVSFVPCDDPKDVWWAGKAPARVAEAQRKVSKDGG